MPTEFPAIIALLAILTAIVLSFKFDLNTGLLALAFALPIGQWLGGLSVKEIISFWPISLFVTLCGVTLLFAIAKVNGTLSLLAQRAIALVGGRARYVPFSLFFLAAILAAIGPGNIAVCALLGPIAMTIGAELGIPPMLISVFLVAGSNAGGLSPFSPTGIIGNSLVAESLKADFSYYIWLTTAITSLVWSLFLFTLLGGWKLNSQYNPQETQSTSFDNKQKLTLICIAFLVVGVIIGKMDVGLFSFLLAAILFLANAASEKMAISSMPWSTLLLVSGTAVLIEVCAHLGGITLLTNWISPWLSQSTAPPLYAIIAAIITFFASASGVTMPMLIKTIPNLMISIPQLSPSLLVAAIIFGAHMVTNGPFTTLGALMAAAQPDNTDRQSFYKQQMKLGLSGIIAAFIGALLISYILPPGMFNLL